MSSGGRVYATVPPIANVFQVYIPEKIVPSVMIPEWDMIGIPYHLIAMEVASILLFTTVAGLGGVFVHMGGLA